MGGGRTWPPLFIQHYLENQHHSSCISLFLQDMSSFCAMVNFFVSKLAPYHFSSLVKGPATACFLSCILAFESYSKDLSNVVILRF